MDSQALWCPAGFGALALSAPTPPIINNDETMRGPWKALLLGGGVALLAWLIVSIGPQAILAMARQMGWGGLAVVGVYAVQQLLRGWALERCVLRPGVVRYVDALLVRLSGEALQVLTAGGGAVGEPLKAWLLKQRGLSGPEGLAATLAEYIVYKLVSAVMMVAALVYLMLRVDLPPALETAARVLLVVGSMFVVVAAVAIACRIYLIGAIVGAAGRLPGLRARWPVDPGWVRRMEDVLLEVLRERPGRFLAVLGLEILASIALLVELWWVLVLLDLPSPLLHAWLVDGATKPMGGIFFFVPGQVGTNEAVLATVFDALGMPAAAGVIVGLLRRVRSVLVASTGLAGLWWLGRARS